MKALMKTVVNRIYEVLSRKDDKKYETGFFNFCLLYARGWDRPEIERDAIECGS